MKYKFLQSHQRGVGLLEIMLTLSVIAVIIILGTRYYEQSKRTQLVNQTVQQIGAIRSAIDRWDSSGKDREEISWDNLRERGYLPSEFGQKDDPDPNNPFGHPITLIGGTLFGIPTYGILQEVGEKPCQALLNKFTGMKGVIARCQNDSQFTVGYTDVLE